MPPETDGAGEPRVPGLGPFLVERGKQFLAIPLPELRRVEVQQQRVEPFHARPFRSFGFDRA